MKKLSNAQARVVDELMSNPNYYIQADDSYWHGQKVINPDGYEAGDSKHKFLMYTVFYFYKPTLDSLLKMNLMVEFDKNKYRLKQSL